MMPYFPNQLAELLNAGPDVDENKRARLARIYGFSYEGQYYDLARPAVYLVFGEGAEIPATVAATGLATQPPNLLSDLRSWTFDQSDLSLYCVGSFLLAGGL